MLIDVNATTQRITLNMALAEWNELLAAINHSLPFDQSEMCRTKYSALITLQERVQRVVWEKLI